MEAYNKRNNDYKDENGYTDTELMRYDYVQGNNGFRKHKLSDILKEMGFSEDSYMVVRKLDEPVRVGEGYDEKGYLKENPCLTFGGYQCVPDSKLTLYDANDEYMQRVCSPSGRLPNGMTGENHGVYAAQAYGGDEIIITKDRRIKDALEQQLSFKKDVMGVPLSLDEKIINEPYKEKWERVSLWGKMIDNFREKGVKLPEPKRLDIDGEYDKVKAVQEKMLLSQMNKYSR